MIEVWRLVKAKFADRAFDGEGARLYGGRWNSRGVPVIYCSSTTSLAVLEVFANVQRADLLATYVVISCSFDASLVSPISPRQLPENWSQTPAPAELAVIGDEWIRSARSAVLAVPSAIIEHEKNYLINPAHSDFKRIRRSDPQPFTFDARLLAKR